MHATFVWFSVRYLWVTFMVLASTDAIHFFCSSLHIILIRNIAAYPCRGRNKPTLSRIECCGLTVIFIFQIETEY